MHWFLNSQLFSTFHCMKTIVISIARYRFFYAYKFCWRLIKNLFDRNRHLVVGDTERCYSCDKQLLTRGFYVFPCQHAFHSDCLYREVRVLLSDSERIGADKLQQVNCVAECWYDLAVLFYYLRDFLCTFVILIVSGFSTIIITLSTIIITLSTIIITFSTIIITFSTITKRFT